MTYDISRRAMLGGLGGLGIGAALGGEATAAAHSDNSGDIFPEAGDKDAWLKVWMRMQSGLEQRDTPWWYKGRIYAQVGEAKPKHLLNLEGTEIYWPRPLGDGAFSISSRTLTFFKDPNTGEMLDEFANPYTGESLPVKANILGGKDGARYTNEGMAMGIENFEMRPWNWQWTRSGRHVWVMVSRGLADMPQPWLEAATMFCLADELADPSIASLRSSFSSTYFSPWLPWMGMSRREGHLIWHSSGCKLESVEETSEAYRERAERLFPGKLTANPDSFD